jgi:hypothetical protein
VSPGFNAKQPLGGPQLFTAGEVLSQLSGKLCVSMQQARQVMSEPGFPAPAVVLPSGRFWSGDDIARHVVVRLVRSVS